MAWQLAAALALAAGSAYANKQAVDAQESARRQAQQAQMARQRKLQQEANARNQEVQEGFERENLEEDMEEIQDVELDRAATAIEQGGEDFSPTDALKDDTPAVIRDAGDKAKARSLAEAMRDARSLTSLQRYGLAGFENNMGLNRNATYMNNIADFAQGNQGIFQADLNEAQRAGDGWSNLGQILGAAGMAMGTYGAMGGAGAAGGAGSLGAAGSAPVSYGSGFGAAANTGTYGGALGNASSAASMAQGGGGLASILQGNYQPLLVQRQRQQRR